MTTTAPSYSDILSVTVASMQSTAVVSVNGTTVLLDMSPGSLNLALATAVAANISALYNRQDDVQASTDFTQATGTDLERIVALLGVVREPAVAAQKPVLIGRQTVSATPVQVPVGWRFVIQTSKGPVDYAAIQGQAEPPGVALTVQAGSAAGWVLGQATSDNPGAVGNTPTGLPAQFGSAIAGLDTISNPPAGVPTVPTYTITGATGAAVRYYRIGGNGVTGKTLPGPVLTVSNANASLDNTHHVDLVWAFGTDGGAVQPNSYDVLVSTDNATWLFLATVTSPAYNDTGATTTGYTLPVSDSSNWGVGGADQEGDEALRQRAPTTIAARSSATATAVADAVLQVPGVASAFGVDVSAGVGQVRVVTVTNPPSAATQTAIDAAIAGSKALGANISKSLITPTVIDYSYTIAAASNVADPTALYAPINTAVTTYLAGLALGAPVHFSAVITAIMGVQGVAAVTALALTVHGGSTYTGADVPASPTVVYRAGTPTSAHT